MERVPMRILRPIVHPAAGMLPIADAEILELTP
jgi:hypothetical protein